MDRPIWTDERIDDMVDRLDKNIDLLREDTRSLRTDMQLLRADMHEGFATMDQRMADGFTSLRRDMLAAVLTMTGALVATMATIIATSL